MTVNVYQPGDQVTISFTVRDSNDTLYDPASVKFHYKDAQGTSYTKIYLIDTDVVSKTSTGLYKLLIFVPYAATSIGDWYYDAQALNAGGQSIILEYSVFNVVDLETL